MSALPDIAAGIMFMYPLPLTSITAKGAEVQSICVVELGFVVFLVCYQNDMTKMFTTFFEVSILKFL